MKEICNILGGTSCGKPIEGKPANVVAAHINRGNQPHEWRRMAQCAECASKDEAGRRECIWNGQDQWREKRHALDMSQGEMARACGLSPADYSQYEACRKVAPKDAVFKVQALWERR